MKHSPIYLFASAGVLSLALAACGTRSVPAAALQAPVPVSTAALQPEVAPSLPANSSEQIAAFEGTLEDIYSNVNASVVNIHVQIPAQQASAIPGLPFGFGSPQTSQPQDALGSGFVWDAEGHIVTNNHVVASAAKISVIFSDGTTVPAQLVGTDVNSDLAVIKVDAPASQLHPVQLADSTQLRVGQFVIAIGNPYGLDGTMTTGIVSSLGRTLPVDSSTDPTQQSSASYSIPDVIQTDASINPGNSGGVLLDEAGRVVGVTSAIISPSHTSAGIGFAIPSVIVAKVVPALIANGHYDHPYLGISGRTLSSGEATAMNLSATQRGALVMDVITGGPAEKAGLHGSNKQATIDGQQEPIGGDVITAVDGQPVTEFDDVITYLARSTEVGQTVTLTVLRDGKEQNLDVKLEPRPKGGDTALASSSGFLGLEGLTLSPELAQAMNLSSDQQGFLIERVVRGGPADTAGLRASFKGAIVNGQPIPVGGDVIVAIDGEQITSTADLVAVLNMTSPHQELTFTILRDGQQMDVKVTLGDHPSH